MKITDIQCHIMNIPRPDGTGVRRNWIFVEIQTDEGITGIGEATTEYHEVAVKAQVESELKPRLLGMDPTDVERIWQLGYRDFWWRQGVVHTSAKVLCTFARRTVVYTGKSHPCCLVRSQLPKKFESA